MLGSVAVWAVSGVNIVIALATWELALLVVGLYAGFMVVVFGLGITIHAATAGKYSRGQETLQVPLA